MKTVLMWKFTLILILVVIIGGFSNIIFNYHTNILDSDVFMTILSTDIFIFTCYFGFGIYLSQFVLSIEIEISAYFFQIIIHSYWMKNLWKITYNDHNELYSMH